MATPKSLAKTSDRVNAQLQALQAFKKSQGESVTERSQPKQYSPDKNGWDGDVVDHSTLGKAFDRKEQNEVVVKALESSSSPGTTGDLAVSVLQGDLLAAAERAYRLRNTGPVRLQMHSAARNIGHGSDSGVHVRGYEQYFGSMLHLAKAVVG